MSTATSHRLSNNFLGILCCVIALFAFAAQDAIVKYLSGIYPVLQILTIRIALVVVILSVSGVIVVGVKVFRTERASIMMFRGFLAFSAFTTYYLALSVTPLATAAAVYMTAPLFVTALSMPLLKEMVGVHRWAAVICGFLAIIIMLNPGSELFHLSAAMPLVSALCYALIPIITRRVGVSEHVLTMAIYTTAFYLFMCLITTSLVHLFPVDNAETGLLFGLFGRWIWPTPLDWLWLGVSSVVFAAGLVLITQAYRVAAVSAVAPFEYSYLLWANILGFMVFSHVPEFRVVAGSVFVVMCGLYVLYRERYRSSE